MSSVPFFEGYSVNELNTLLRSAEVQTTLWGERRVVVGSMNINMNLLTMRNKIQDFANRCITDMQQPFDATFLQQRAIGADLAARCNNLLWRSDESLKASSLFTRTLAWLQELPQRLHSSAVYALGRCDANMGIARQWLRAFLQPLDHKVSLTAFRTFSKEEFTFFFMQDQLRSGYTPSEDDVVNHGACLGVDSKSTLARRFIISERAFMNLRVRFLQNSDFVRANATNY